MTKVESKNSSFNIDALSFRISDNKVSAHFPLNFSHCKNFLVEVVMGPKCKTDESIIRLLLKENGFEHVRVSKSRASYR